MKTKRIAAFCLAALVPLAAWGITWVIPKAPTSTEFDNILWGADAFSTTHAWAVGRAETGTLPIRKPVILRWDGTRWRLSQNPLPPDGGELRDVDTLGTTSAWAVGYTYSDDGNDTLVERWNGSSWSIVPSPNRAAQNWLLAVKAFGANDVWAVGSNNVPNTLFFETMVQRWDGTSWSIVPSPSPDPFESHLLAMDGVASDDLWAVGYTQASPDAIRAPLAMHWDGFNWQVTSIPPVNDSGLEGIVAIASDDVWAVGFTFSVQLLWQVPYAIHWDGESWTNVPIPVSSPQGGHLYDVTALSSGQVWAVGESGSSSIPILVMRWDGAAWTVETGPAPRGSAVIWDATTFGSSDLLLVGSSAKVVHGNLQPSRPLVVRGVGG
jgi:hypothetical protein